MEQVQVAQAPIHVPTPTANSVPQAPKEPRVSLPEKFDGDHTKLQDFVNQIWLVFRLQLQRYATEETRVRIINTLFSRTTLSWFSSLLQKNYPLLTDLDQFFGEFSGTLEKEIESSLQQRLCPASAYVAEFQELKCDLKWNDTALIIMFRWVLCDNIKILLLNLPKPTTLAKAITQATDFDNRLFEQRQERRLLFGSYQADYAASSRLSSSNTSTSKPMQIDT